MSVQENGLWHYRLYDQIRPLRGVGGEDIRRYQT